MLLRVGAGILLAVLIFLGARWSSRERILLDYGSFIASGRAASEGLNPYGVYDLTFRVGGIAPAPNLNPPISIMPFEALGKFDAVASRDAFYMVSLALYAYIVVTLLTLRGKQVLSLWGLWAFALGGLWHTLELGQIYVPLLALATAGWLLLERKQPWPAGIAIGALAAVKPTFLLWPVILLAARHGRVAAGAFATFLVLSAIPVFAYGPHIYEQWWNATPGVLDTPTLAGNSSLVAVGGRLGSEGLGLLVALVLAAAIGLWALLVAPDARRASSMALLGALLVGPITWPGYTILLLPAVLGMRVNRLTITALALLCFPYWEVIRIVENPGWPVTLGGSVYFAALVLLLCDFAYREWMFLKDPAERARIAKRWDEARQWAPMGALLRRPSDT